jgi:hypothetical protein
LLLDKGLIRIGLAIPTGSEFSIASVADPFGCNTNPVTGLTSPTSGIVSTYRRPLPSANLAFINAIMWNGREPSLESQATDATNEPRAGDDAANSRSSLANCGFRNWRSRCAELRQSRARSTEQRRDRRPGIFLPATVAAFFPGILIWRLLQHL